ncbi:MAG: GNAT family N-acetyltransferase [Rhodospirillales bacterium]
MNRLRDARFPEDRALVQGLFRDYQSWLGVDLCFQDFSAELEGLPGSYAPPRGAVLLAEVDGLPAGVVAMRPLESSLLGAGPLAEMTGSVAEMKRLYVMPAFQGQGLGRALAEAVLARARNCGYRTMVLDTLTRLTAALALYRHLGFEQGPAYTTNPLDGVLFLRRDLGS